MKSTYIAKIKPKTCITALSPHKHTSRAWFLKRRDPTGFSFEKTHFIFIKFQKDKC